MAIKAQLAWLKMKWFVQKFVQKHLSQTKGRLFFQAP